MNILIKNIFIFIQNIIIKYEIQYINGQFFSFIIIYNLTKYIHSLNWKVLIFFGEFIF